MKATQDFEYASIQVKAGDEVKPGMFEADQIQSLLAKGLLVDTEYHEEKPKKSAKKAEHK